MERHEVKEFLAMMRELVQLNRDLSEQLKTLGPLLGVGHHSEMSQELLLQTQHPAPGYADTPAGKRK